MRCNEARTLILEADPSELAGTGEGPLAGHLRACGACAERAALILRTQADLDRALDTLGPGMGATEAAERASLAPRRAGRRWMLPAAGLAAAAALVAVVLSDVADPPTGRVTPGAGAARAAAEDVPAHVALELSPERPAVLLATRNPAITVVWYP